mmetsp:Transcript_51754/g.150282  ORF Transcript_51754/g.150282 Transcript_51754/m.150282 type:complete len:247 (-) Transcript_51754:696-1436(-)
MDQLVLNTIQVKLSSNGYFFLRSWKQSQEFFASKLRLPYLRSFAAPHALLVAKCFRCPTSLSRRVLQGMAASRAASAQPHRWSSRCQADSVLSSVSPYSLSAVAAQAALRAISRASAPVTAPRVSALAPALPPGTRRTVGTRMEHTARGGISTLRSMPPPSASMASAVPSARNLPCCGSVKMAFKRPAGVEKAARLSFSLQGPAKALTNTQARQASGSEKPAAAHGSVHCSISNPGRKKCEKCVKT